MSLSDNLPARNAVNTQTNNPLLMTLESAGSFIRESGAPPGGEREYVCYQKWTYASTRSDFGRPKVDPDLVFANQMWT